jgi:hypothetical protein
MAHAQKPDFVFRRNGRVHLNRRGPQFSRLLAAEVCPSVVVMLDKPCSEVVWRVLATHSLRQFPFTSPPVRHRVPSHFNWSLRKWMVLWWKIRNVLEYVNLSCWVLPYYSSSKPKTVILSVEQPPKLFSRILVATRFVLNRTIRLKRNSQSRVHSQFHQLVPQQQSRLYRFVLRRLLCILFWTTHMTRGTAHPTVEVTITIFLYVSNYPHFTNEI